MLKKLAKSGEYTNLFIMISVLLIYYITPAVNFANSPIVTPAAPIGFWLDTWISNNIGWSKLINVALVIILSWYLNILSTRYEIIPRQSSLVAGILPFFMLFTPEPQFLTATLVVIMIYIFILDNILNIGKRQNPSLQVLNASMSIALASMIIPHSILFILLVWFGFLTYSVNSWREWLISLIGLILPYIYMFFAFLWSDNITYIIGYYKKFFSEFNLEASLPSTMQIVSLSILFVIFIMSMLHFVNDASDKTLVLRKRMGIVSQFAFVTAITVFLSGNSIFIVLPIFFIPFVLMFSYSIHNLKKSRIYDIIFFLLIISFLVNRLTS